MPKRTPDDGEIRLCWRHNLRMFLAAFGTLMDLTGKHYPAFARRVLDDARRCPHCHYPNGAR